MQTSLKQAIAQQKNLKYLQEHFRKDSQILRFSSFDNILYQLCRHDSSIGTIRSKQIQLLSMGWIKIVRIVEQETGLNLAIHDISELSAKNRIEGSAFTNDEKLLSVAPTKGFIQVRLLIKNEKALDNKNHNMVLSSLTPQDYYIGIKAEQLVTLGMDNLIVIENFTPFVQMTAEDIYRIQGIDQSQSVAVIYRGHDDSNIYAVSEILKASSANKYIFVDYDFAGLQLAYTLSQAINATGIILPGFDTSISTLKSLSKNQSYLEQAHIQNPSRSLALHFQRLKENFLAITQESLLKFKINVMVFNVQFDY